VLVAVGREDLAPGQVAGLLTSESDIPAKLTAPASGLFLERVFYEGDPQEVDDRSAPFVLRLRN
jgi:tRNA pseudouridine38-40 synthase